MHTSPLLAAEAGVTHPEKIPTAVLYDWDNTLVDNWGTVAAALNHALVTFGHAPWSPDEARMRIRQSLRDSFPTLFGDRWTEARDVFYAYFDAHHLEHLRPLPGAESLLAALAERGVWQAVVSNKTGRFLRAEAEALGWTGYFARLVGAQDAERDKPDCAPVRMALDGSGLEPGSAVWFIGDADIDMECAHASGCVPILIGDKAGEGIGQYPPRYRFPSCQSLNDLVMAIGDTIFVPAQAGAAGHV